MIVLNEGEKLIFWWSDHYYHGKIIYHYYEKKNPVKSIRTLIDSIKMIYSYFEKFEMEKFLQMK